MTATQSPSHTNRFEVPFPGASLELVRQHAPEAYACLSNAYEQAYRAADLTLLELARLRIAGLLDPGGKPAAHPICGLSEQKLRSLEGWSDAEVYTPAERACLAFVDQFVFYVADVSNELIDDLLRHLHPDEVYGFVNAVYVLDAVRRLSLSLDVVFDSEEDRHDVRDA
jgi:hypothetical protein